MYPERQKTSASAQLGVIGLVSSGLFIFFCCSCFGVALVSSHWTSVKSADQMTEREHKHLKQADVLEPGEQLVAYLDATTFGTGEHLQLITDQRVVNHTPVNDTAIPLSDIGTVDTSTRDAANQIYAIESQSGVVIRVKIGNSEGVGHFGRLLGDAMRQAGNDLDFDVPLEE